MAEGIPAEMAFGPVATLLECLAASWAPQHRPPRGQAGEQRRKLVDASAAQSMCLQVAGGLRLGTLLA